MTQSIIPSTRNLPSLPLLAALLVAACTSGDGGSGEPPPCIVRSLTLNPTAATVVAGSEVTLQVSVVQENCGAGVTVEWRSSALTVAAVAGANTSAIVRGVNPGTATVTATATGTQGSAEATAAILVTGAPIASLTVTPATATVPLGGQLQLTAELRDTNNQVVTGRQVLWSSSNDAVAPVDAAGVVRGAGLGTARISALAEGKLAFSDVSVVLVPVASVTVAPASASLLVGQTVQLTATALDVSGNVLTGRTFTWVSSAPAVASVSATGLVTALTPGTTRITVTSEGRSANADIGVGSSGDASRFAWATIETPGAAPSITRSFNGRGGNVTVARTLLGQYRLTFGGMGDPLGVRAETSETVLVSALGGLLTQCGLSDWSDAGSALHVDVHCVDLAGNFQDAAFSVLVVGRGTLMGASAFVRSTTLTPDYAPDPRWSWNSAEAPMRLTLSGSSRIVDFGASSGTGAGFFATPFNPALAGICAPFGHITGATIASLRCFGPDGVPQDRLFTMLMVQGGRASKPNARWGFASIEDAGAAQTQPPASLARSSSGGAITSTRLAQGRWRVRFTGLAAPGGAREEVVHVSPLGSPYGACLVEDVQSAGADLDVTVRCWSAAGTPVDHAFAVLVLE